MLKVQEQLEDAINLFYMKSMKKPSTIYMSCNLVTVLLNDISGFKYTEEYVREIKALDFQYKGVPIYRIVEDGHIVINN